MNRLNLLSHCISNSPPTPQFTKISIYYKGAVGYISMRSPKDLNSLGDIMMKQLCEALKLLHNDQHINVVVIVSELNNIFCAGADIKRFASNTFDYELGVRDEPLQVLMEGFQKCRKPIIAGVNGKALGGGFELALMCDIIVASEKAFFGLPEINLGLMPGLGGTQRLAKIVGQKKAMRHILTGEGFDAADAWKMNVAQKASFEKFGQQIQALAQKIANKALTTVMVAKKTVKQSSNLPQKLGIDFQKDVFYSLLNTKAAKQGITAFVNKKKPDFKGL